jgi:hypothetical protein
VFAGVIAFAVRWDGLSRGCGWSPLELYGLHRRAPWSNLAGMGAAFLIAIGGHTVIGIGAEAIAVATPTGSRLRIFRRPPDSLSAPAWELERPEIL